MTEIGIETENPASLNRNHIRFFEYVFKDFFHGRKIPYNQKPWTSHQFENPARNPE